MFESCSNRTGTNPHGKKIQEERKKSAYKKQSLGSKTVFIFSRSNVLPVGIESRVPGDHQLIYSSSNRNVSKKSNHNFSLFTETQGTNHYFIIVISHLPVNPLGSINYLCFWGGDVDASVSLHCILKVYIKFLLVTIGHWYNNHNYD